MQAIFAHDHVFVRWEDGVYSPGRLPYQAWHRYLEHFSSLVVIARARAATSAEEVKGMSRSDGPRVRFELQAAHRGARRLLSSGSESRRNVRRLIDSADAVIARIPSRIGSIAVAEAAKAGVPSAVEVVGSAFHALWHHGSVAAKVYAPLLDLQTKRAAWAADSALYVTKDYLQRRYPCRGPTVSASNVVVPRPDNTVLGERRIRLRSRTGPLIVGFVGTLADRHKGLDTLLEALALASDQADCMLKVVGEGNPAPWRSLSKQLGVHGNVEFVGALPGSAAVRAWMETIDLFVMPSKGGEGLPRALIEAMSCGCAAYATDVGGVAELLPSRCLLRPGQAHRLADLIVEAACNQCVLLDAIDMNAAAAERYAADILESVRREFFGHLAERVRACARMRPRS